jgi:phosphopentomutase
MKHRRVFLIVMDSVGVGKASDAAKFNDLGANTFLHIDKEVGGLKVPNLESLGWGYLDDYIGLEKLTNFKGYVGRAQERSNGKDTMTGHWEFMGVLTSDPFITFTDNGFPKELLDELTSKWGRGYIGNKAASGTEILDELGLEHANTGKYIVYTSADSVLQIAANKDIVPLEELYRACAIAREVTLVDKWKVGRVIARPFVGDKPGNYKRTSERHDYALSPSSKTYLDYLKEDKFDVISVGKINDIFNTQGITEAYKSKSNIDGMNITIKLAKEKDFTGVCFVNLVEFDSEFGHRRNVKGYANCLEEFDTQLGELISVLREDDLLVLTADHGNDPTWTGTDHTREEIPVIYYSKLFQSGQELEKSDTFADIGATIAKNFGIKVHTLLGKNVLK